MMMMIGDFPLSGEFKGTNSVYNNDDFPPRKYFHGRSNDIGEDSNHFPTKTNIPLSDHGPTIEDQVLGHSSETTQDGGHYLIKCHSNVEYSDSEDDIPFSDEDIPTYMDDDIPVNTMEPILINTLFVTRTRNTSISF
jgi:hypothetical protein